MNNPEEELCKDYIEQVLKQVHNLNNALASAEGFLSILQDDIAEEGENRFLLDKSYAAVEKAMEVSDTLFEISQNVKNASKS